MTQILRVDLDAGECRFEELVDPLLGGHALTAKVVSDEVPPEADPLGPENVFVIAAGVLAGTAVPNTGRLSVGCKSPLTGGTKEANSGGSVARKLARLGVRGIVVTGKAAGPTMLEVDAAGARLKACPELAGKGTAAVIGELRTAYGEDGGVVCIGPAGEKMLKTAAVIVTTPDFYPRTASRGGVGAVMGSKNLKAVVVNDKGAPGLAPAEPEGLREAAAAISEGIRSHPAMGGLEALGSAMLVNMANGLGCLATRNFAAGQFEGTEAISGETLAGVLAERANTQAQHRCMAGCVVNCSQVYTDAEGRYVTSGLEYETLGLLGSNCLISDLDAIARMNALCDDLGLDTMEIGAAVAVAMEAGRLSWGDAQAAYDTIAGIATGDEFSMLIAEGTLATGKALGVERIPVVKGQSLAVWDPRFLKGTGCTYATSPQGADHTAGNAIPNPGNPDYDTTNPDQQPPMSQFLQAWFAGIDSLGFCLFPSLAMLDMPQLWEKFAVAVEALTGEKVEYENFIPTLGMGVLRGELAFNCAAGFTREDDRLPEFLTKEPLPPSGQVFDVPDAALDGIFA
jgi:aldehyde:ferredoxin oxidoreductase